MIQLECSNCKTALSIDDAFAGGVCRCQQCGTIQTVPKPGEPAAASASQKALFKRKARIESALSPYSDGLERAADELGSSASLSASELANINAARRTPSPADSSVGQRSPASAATATVAPPRSNGKPAGDNASPRPATETQAAPRSYVPRPSKSAAVPVTVVNNTTSKKPLVFGAGVAAGVVVLGIIWLLIPSSKPQTQTQTPTQTQPPPTAVVIKPIPVERRETPVVAPPVAKTESPPVVIEIKVRDTATPATICGLPIEGTAVVYILDRAGCTQSAFRQITDACLKSVESLGAKRKFQVAVWNNYKDLSFPETGLAGADAVGVDGARKAIVDTYAGSNDIASIITKAKSAGATDIVLISAVDLDDVHTQSIHDALAEQSIKFHGIAVGKDLTAERLRALAGKFSGGFKQIDLDALN